ncbi:Intraflagellar transport protein 43 [Tetrabaena socialis]|uniref:Intraflagellar transport protein 43 n=1 Tax=Tetrabaena socialis TaxID=47790 RepID=A0A2J7ZZZ6_9CHLO|nr:Intraflagellar transport protein 43 [Tetrabaena socialis]|eukprot:PNH05826.1 Intraflagellar transport protein 43 [Tetrabaena socialis]
MDDDAPKAAPKAGRRAARNVNNWGDESSAPPEPQKPRFPQGGFGLDADIGSGSSGPPPPARAKAGFAEEPSIRKGGPGGGSISMSPPQQQEEESAAPSRQRTIDSSVDRSSSQRAPPAVKPSNAEGFSDDKKFVGVSRRKQEQLARGDDDVSRKNLKYEAMTAGVDGIMEIPELEEEGREDLSNVVAEAPKVRTNKVQGMEELEEDMHYKLPAMDDRDIDLSLLTAVLCSSEQVQEAEELWDPDIVLTEVASAINAEREKAEGGEPAGGDDLGKDEILIGK